MKNLPLLLGLFLLCQSSSLQAQYTGGNGRGDAIASSESLSLNGGAVAYAGGIGRGDAVAGNESLSLNGGAVAYSGGIGRGDAWSSKEGSTLNGGAVAYIGGIGRGDITAGFTASYLNGNLPFSIGVFIEGFYVGSSLMSPVLFNNGLSGSSTACDSITVELRDTLSLSSVLFTQKTLLRTNGLSGIAVPPGLIGSYCYIVVKHRNALETWSKTPVIIASNQIFNFRNP